jgi:hypothetical protein
MQYSSSDYQRRIAQDQVKVAVLADTLQAEQAKQQYIQDLLWAGAAIAAALSLFTLLH